MPARRPAPGPERPGTGRRVSYSDAVSDPQSGAFTGWDAGLEAGTLRLTTSQQVANHIRRMIFDGTLRTGDRLRQEDLAAQLGVSRIPVREAVIALDREGWVRMESHRGAYVNGLDADSVRDHYELLGRVYGFVAARVAERGGDLDGVRAGVDAVVAAQDPEAFWRGNAAFFGALVTAARSARLASVVRLLSIPTGLIPNTSIVEMPHGMDRQKETAQRVLAALEDGDGATAERVLVENFRRGAEAAVEVLARHDLLSPDAGDGPRG